MSRNHQGKQGDLVQCRVWLPSGIRNQAVTVSKLVGYHALGPFLRQLIVEGVAAKAREMPRTHLHLRPNSHVYQVHRKRFTPLVQSAGGERVWVLGVGPTLPKALGGGICYKADVTSGDETGGIEGRGVFVRQVDCF